MPDPVICELTGTVFTGRDTDDVASLPAPFPRKFLTITPLSITGALLSTKEFRVYGNSVGVFAFGLYQGAQYNIKGYVAGYNSQSGTNVTIPSAASALLKDLTSMALVPVTGLTVYNEGVPLPGLYGAVDFIGGGVDAILASAGRVSVTIAGGAGLPVVDTQTVVKGSADATKLLRFEVDGFTTGTTRVATWPNKDGTVAMLDDITGGGTWGGITGTLSDQTDLQTALDAKQNAFANQNANLVFAGPGTGAAAAPAFRSLVALDIPALPYEPTLGFTAVPTTRTVNGHALSANVTVTPTDLGLVIGTNVQAWSADLDAVDALAGNSGFLKKTALNTWSLDTSTYLTSVQDGAADGATKGVAGFTAADFDSASGIISLDYTNAQKASGSVPGFLSAADWTVFNDKQPALGFTAVPNTRTVNGHALSGNISVTAGDVGLGSVENTALSTWAGSSNLTTLGTIGTGSWNATVISLAKGGTGVALSDPGAHTLLGWDDTDGAVAFITIGSGLTYTQATHTLSASGAGVALGDSPTWTGIHDFAPTLRSSGVAPYLKITTPADTGQTANTEFPGVVFGGNSSFASVTRTGADGTTYALQREYIFVPPTYAFAGATTVTQAVSLYTASPVVGSNATFTSGYGALFEASAAAHIPLALKGAGSQSGDFLRVIDSTNAILMRIGSNGTPFASGNGYSFTGQPTSRIGIFSTTYMIHYQASSEVFGVQSGGIELKGDTAKLLWNTSGVTTAINTGIGRNAASVVEINNGTSGQWGSLLVGTRDASTNVVSNSLTLGHQSTGTPAAGLGSGILFNINSTTTADQATAQLKAAWYNATHASRVAWAGIATNLMGSTTLIDRFITGPRTTLVDATATSLFEIALPTLAGASGVIEVTIYATDATDSQVRSQIIRYSATNKAAVYTSEIVIVSEAASCSAGTLTCSWSIVTGTNKITIKATADTSLASTTSFYVTYTLKNNSEQAITLL